MELRNSTRSLYVTIILLAVAVSAAVGASLYLQYEFPSLEAERSLGSNVGFFLLINLNIIVVMVLGFLVTKNIVKLVLDRRRNILGAKLRTRLVTAFVGLSLIPTVLLFLVAKGMLERGLQEWLSPQIVRAVDGALAVAKYHYDSAESQLYRHTHHLSRRFAELYPYTLPTHGVVPDLNRPEVRSALKTYLEEKREEYGLFDLAIVDGRGRAIIRAESLEAMHSEVEVPGANQAAIRDALSGAILVRPEQSINGEFLRGYAPLSGSETSGLSARVSTQSSEASARYAITATMWVLPELSKTLGSVVNAYDDYKELQSYRRPLVSSYFLTLVVVTFLIVFAAVWVGFYLARELSVPIGLLAEATQQVASGNLDYHITEVGDDELSVLVRSFNTMTDDLKGTTGELVERRRYMETILASVRVGVISFNTGSILTTCNPAASEMLGIEADTELLGRHFSEVLPEELAKKIVEVLEELQESGGHLKTENLTLNVRGEVKHLQLALTPLVDEQGGVLGAVLLIDDLTELVSAQRMAAWREVARRIAHEIKNPLTPIQLCAERIQRKFATAPVRPKLLEEQDRVVITESTDIIIKQVDNLRTLVNEFSRFARMPKSNLRQADLNKVLVDTVAIFREAHPQIEFQLRLDPQLPTFALDAEQMSRVVINLIDNSIAAVQSCAERLEVSSKSSVPLCGALSRELRAEGQYHGVITVETTYDDSLGLVTLNVSDNGIGIEEKDKQRLFEPYFSTKRGGSGLGLAIVNTIVSDHHGFVRVRDTEPHGACFTIELPLSRDSMRKLA